jgi:radical SAM protein with 4Fe4S-binding SPASM domain
MRASPIRPERIFLQWHVTERCNLNCRHCYQTAGAVPSELSTDVMVGILDQFVALIKVWNLPAHCCNLNITGGEPFIRNDFVAFLDEVQRRRRWFRWSILSNGMMLNEDIVKTLRAYGISGYQVSLEGCEEVNDSIRGKGTYRETLKAIEMLTRAGIDTRVSLTMTKECLDDLSALCEVVRRSGAVSLSARRLVPIGSGGSIGEPTATWEIYEAIRKLKKQYEGERFWVNTGCESAIRNRDADEPTKPICSLICSELMTIMPNGDAVACRRLPIEVGNVLKQSLLEIWYSSDILNRLRNLNNAHPFCRACDSFGICYGGAKCAAHARYGKLFVPDPQCRRFSASPPAPDHFGGYIEPVSRQVKHCPSLLHP